ncbi:hypothetical protein L596_011732 [Steinernema carpocapsae]|nr:hypothetical protein L596_011732 [Steinernema carpocapsae]
MRNGYFEDAAKLQKTAKQMKKLSEDIAKFKEEVEDIKEKSRRARKRMEDTWTPPMSAENLPPRYENERCLFYGTTEVISTYSKASQSIAECLKVLQDVKLMSGRLEVQTLNGVKHLKRTIKSMEVAEEIIDDAMNSNYFDHTV